MRSSRFLLGLFSFFALFSFRAHALNPKTRLTQYGHSVWRVQDGTFSAAAHAITQTTDGYIWIGTDAGLIRFDGVRFVPWISLKNEPILDTRISSLNGIRDGSLWIGTEDGAARWKDRKLTKYVHPKGRIHAIVEDHGGAVWIVRSRTDDSAGVLCQIKDNVSKCFSPFDRIPITGATPFGKDDEGNLWLAGQDALYRWKIGPTGTGYKNAVERFSVSGKPLAIALARDGSVWAGVSHPREGSLLLHMVNGVWHRQSVPGLNNRSSSISQMFVDPDDTLWIGTTNQGMYRVRGDSVDNYRSADGLSSDYVDGFMQDRDGNLWVATSKGLDFFRDLHVVTFSVREGLTSDSVSSVVASQDGTVWVGNGEGLDHIKENSVSSIRARHGLPGTNVTSLFEDSSGVLWVGLDNGLQIYKDQRFQAITRSDSSPVGVVFAMAEDREHNVWADVVGKGHEHQLVRVRDYKVQETLSSEEISPSFVLGPAPKRGVWLGLDNAIAQYLDGALQVFPIEKRNKLAAITNMFVDPAGTVWLSTLGGLIGWKNGEAHKLSSRNGLPCDSINSAIKDLRGDLWLFAQCGVTNVSALEIQRWWKDSDTLIQSRTFSLYDGAQPGITLFQPRVSMTPDGRLWYANDSVLQVIDPAHLDKPLAPPPVHVEQVIANRTVYLPGRQLRLPSLIHDLEIDYTALVFAAPQKVHFRYKLEGFDKDWQDAGTRRQAFYTNLHPGTYRFQVLAANSDGIWNTDGATVMLTLAPAIYQTAWFITICTGLGLFAIWIVHRTRAVYISTQIRSRLEERMKERESVARDLHDTLLQSVQGLTLSLYAVKKRVPEAEPAHQMIEDTLERTDQVLLEARDRVENLRRASQGQTDLADSFIEAGREIFQDSAIQFRVRVEGQPRDLHPVVRDEAYWIGREALVNACKHGDARKVDADISYSGKTLQLQFRDDGRGIDPGVLEAGGRPRHWGLKGMRERARKIGGHLDIQSAPGMGTEIKLTVPARVAYQQKESFSQWNWMLRLWGHHRTSTVPPTVD